MLATANPMTKVLVALLLFESITCGLAIAVMIQINNVHIALAAMTGGGVAVLALLACVLLRRGRLGWTIAWLTQGAAVALGLVTWAMFVMGAVFFFLWLVTYVLGRRIADGTAAAT